MSQRLRAVEVTLAATLLVLVVVGIPTFGWLPFAPLALAVATLLFVQVRAGGTRRPEYLLRRRLDREPARRGAGGRARRRAARLPAAAVYLPGRARLRDLPAPRRGVRHSAERAAHGGHRLPVLHGRGAVHAADARLPGGDPALRGALGLRGAGRRHRVALDGRRRRAHRRAQPPRPLLARGGAAAAGAGVGGACRADPRRSRPLQGRERRPRPLGGRRRAARGRRAAARLPRGIRARVPDRRRGVRRARPGRRRGAGAGAGGAPAPGGEGGADRGHPGDDLLRRHGHDSRPAVRLQPTVRPRRRGSVRGQERRPRSRPPRALGSGGRAPAAAQADRAPPAWRRARAPGGRRSLAGAPGGGARPHR